MSVTGDPVAALSRSPSARSTGHWLDCERRTALTCGSPATIRLDAVRAHLHEKAGHLDTAAEHYARAAAATRSTAERDHLTK
jgi:predicted RNA polymerase sigma factor